MIGELPVIADLKTTNEAGRTMRQEDALLRLGVGVIAQAAATVAEVTTDIKAGPVINPLHFGLAGRPIRFGPNIKTPFRAQAVGAGRNLLGVRVSRACRGDKHQNGEAGARRQTASTEPRFTAVIPYRRILLANFNFITDHQQLH
ncbi:hypothetical protein D9M73_135060 [compost metagenome]